MFGIVEHDRAIRVDLKVIVVAVIGEVIDNLPVDIDVGVGGVNMCDEDLIARMRVREARMVRGDIDVDHLFVKMIENGIVVVFIEHVDVHLGWSDLKGFRVEQVDLKMIE